MRHRYKIVERVATPQEYRHLCTQVGWGEVMNFEAATTALPRSLYGVVAMLDHEVVGMGRIVGDGAIFYYLQDIAVLPDHQGQGIGTRIVDRLVALVKDNAPEKAFFGVFAAEGTRPFYQRFGFDLHPVLTGMFQVVP
ncbi:MAG: GNAT family N-acetyltransferase [Anaerolineae bacterium]